MGNCCASVKRKCIENHKIALGPEGAFELPFEGQLCEDNRWIVLSKLIPWSLL